MPVQYHDGVLACGGWLYRYENRVFTPLGGPGAQETFNWSSGVFLGDYYYLAGQNTLYAVDTETGEVAEAFVFDPARKTNNQGGTVYDADTAGCTGPPVMPAKTCIPWPSTQTARWMSSL